MKKPLCVSVLFLLFVALMPAVVFPQYPQIKISLRVSDHSDSSRTVYWGVDPAATIGIDPALGEEEQPPIPPVGTLDARMIGDSLGTGTRVDLREFRSNSQTDTFRVRYQPSSRGGYPMKIKWSKAVVQQYYLSSVRMVDEIGSGGTVVNVDMKTTDSVVITDTRFAHVRIEASGPLGPNEIRGTVFHDFLGNGVKAPPDTGLPGWAVYLGGDQTDTSITDSTGAFVFRDLPNGNYVVSRQIPSGWMSVLPPGGSYNLSLGGGDVADSTDFGNFIPGSVGGVKFNDVNANGIQDGGESGIPGWRMYLRGDAVDSTLTDGTGQYVFPDLGPGTYRVLEKQDPNWFQIWPGNPGYHTVTITSGLNVTGKRFGNKLANAYVGAPGGSWSDSSNWSFGHVPGPGDPVVVSVPLVVDALTTDSILGLRIGEGGKITYSSGDSLVVLQSVQIDSGGELQFPPAAGSPTASAFVQSHLIVYGDWINNGNFDPGGSLVTMAGNEPKTIDASTFYDLEIRGNQTSSGGSIAVLNSLFLRNTFLLRDTDTLLVSNPAADAIVDTGTVPRGTIKRGILEGETRPYRFSSTETSLAFLPGGDMPEYMLVTTEPGVNPPSFQLDWEIVGGTADPETHTVTADSVGGFSKWALGTPRPQSSSGEPQVERSYTILPEGGSGFLVKIVLAYDPSEVMPGTDESGLKLLRDPQVFGAVRLNWNLVSLPVIPELTAKTVLFPTALSEAYRYDDGYVVSPDLGFGAGYWLKFAEDAEIGFTGLEVISAELALSPGWNLVGSLTFPVDVSTIIASPEGMISGPFYKYEGSYQAADYLEPAEGYWVKASVAGTVTLSTAVGPAAKRHDGRQDLSFLNTLTFTDGRGREQVLYYSARSTGLRRMFELPPLPPEGAFDVRFVSGFQMEIPADSAAPIPIAVSSAEYPLTVRWKSQDPVPGALLSVDGEGYAIDGEGSVSVHRNTSMLALVLPGRETVPAVFSLSQCYPNPFNPVTTIEYSLPIRVRAVMRVFNVLGEEVAVLVDEIRDAGTHRVRFDAGRLPTGVYFYRLEAGQHSSVKKLVLMK